MSAVNPTLAPPIRQHGMPSWRSELQALKMGDVLALGYSGPPMRRPVASNEVRWLARALVRASDAANAALGLDQPPVQAEQQQNGALQVGPVPLSHARHCCVAFPLPALCWRALHKAQCAGQP